MAAINLMLDSGAFSAWMKQTEINLDEYIAFCLEHLDCLTAIVNLDVIPGRFGQKRLPPEEIERAAAKGYENYHKMLEAGIPKEKLIHVFHQGETMDWLDRMVKEIPYIGLSPANDRTTEEKILWLDACMPHVTDDDGMPLNKWHGFAVTSLRLMKRYPWYSVDSTSWVVTSRNGQIYVPKGGNYLVDPWKVSVSSRSPDKEAHGEHYSTMSARERRVVDEYLASIGFVMGESELYYAPADCSLAEDEKWAGKPLTNGERLVERIITRGVCNDYMLRDQVNIKYFLELEKALPKWPWPFKSKTKGFGL